uniref:Regulator of G protein signaling 5b n=1 Tax=Acanthochromis polyacanthus TaxID=80966 RepID=A0A3Q1HPK8_9TELE
MCYFSLFEQQIIMLFRIIKLSLLPSSSLKMTNSSKTFSQLLFLSISMKFVNEPLKWKESFEKLLSSQNGLCLFRAFLVSEFSEENIAFYLACEDYRTTKPSKLAAKAKKIYDEFIGSDTPREVNLDHVTKAITKENVEQPTQSCFDLAQAKIYTLMEKDCYPRFLKSSMYLELTRKTKRG